MPAKAMSTRHENRYLDHYQREAKMKFRSNFLHIIFLYHFPPSAMPSAGFVWPSSAPGRGQVKGRHSCNLWAQEGEGRRHQRGGNVQTRCGFRTPRECRSRPLPRTTPRWTCLFMRIKHCTFISASTQRRTRPLILYIQLCNR